MKVNKKKKTSLFKLQALMLSVLMLSSSLMLTGCYSEDDTIDEDILWYEDKATLNADYAFALNDAQLPLLSEVSTTLMPIDESNPELEWITVGDKKLVLVCTMLSENSLKYWQATDTFRISKQTGIWVTLPQEWKHKQ